MRYKQLLRYGPPCFYLTVRDDHQFENLRYELSRNQEHVAVRAIRGCKSRTWQTFYDEIGAALQFPHYFGEILNALNDCLTDLEWIEASAYVVMISEAEILLSDEDDDAFDGAISCFEFAHREWLQISEHDPRNLPPTPFHVVFQCEAAGIGIRTQPAQRMIDRLMRAQAGVEFLEE